MTIAPHVRNIIFPIHCLGIIAIVLLYTGYIELNFLWCTFWGWVLISGFGISIGFHRLISHCSFETSPLIRGLLAYLGCMGAQGSPVFWASLHMGIHHPYSDTPRDLHSPVNGKWNSYMGWQFRLRPEQVPFRYGTKLIKEPWLRFLHTNYYKIFWGSSIFAIVIDYRLGLMGVILPALISLHQENIIDLFCHVRSWGYRNFDTPDNSVNNILLGLVAFGQGWHNNHHRFPDRYNFGIRWFEFDICRLFVHLIAYKQKKRV